ncbi:MAG: hypothetical protein A3I71_06560 [Omnitrophica WOR_2 bacterium RIFCSPLOWO2_02_FULL_63_16]|nr:MAG: hypothetical protein A2Z92_00530 [Omnitrophica WOR_2 bacterium GWA2_63_20]OGX32450.1 MAG: hypothetical protein A3E56_03610 [Omnitrophica WOR_2 bacterium RIFCSPHIGHO2_12_FULL_64_13]OGX36278.1 MAG: hypothetical protein A3B73_03290 [Omnitrophica WOR_2 bacterium RIFCSPHIGHO2_02_FULL_63_39]OGX46115.1 MAG: hypothetical protein A3I71_06560 [Omnitrophica WOR_2 bacterium RIFCSPLOWO2_02_FULL_63_16]
MARQRGMTAAELARRLGLYRSNLSAMDAGTRSVSLKTLARIAGALSCSPGDLLEIGGLSEPRVFRGKTLNRLLVARDQQTVDGADRAWTHAALLAWQRHYRHPHAPRHGR